MGAEEWNISERKISSYSVSTGNDSGRGLRRTQGKNLALGRKAVEGLEQQDFKVAGNGSQNRTQGNVLRCPPLATDGFLLACSLMKSC